MNLNTCTARLLSNLPGINQTLAQAVIDCRRTRPSQLFTHLDQLWKVDGMSRTSFRILDRYVEIRQQKTPCMGEVPYAYSKQNVVHADVVSRDSTRKLGAVDFKPPPSSATKGLQKRREFRNNRISQMGTTGTRLNIHSRSPSPSKFHSRTVSRETSATLVRKKSSESGLPPIAQQLFSQDISVPDNLTVSQSGNRITLQYRFENDRVSIPHTVYIRAKPGDSPEKNAQSAKSKLAKVSKQKSSAQRVSEDKGKPRLREAWVTSEARRTPCPRKGQPNLALSPRRELEDQFDELSMSLRSKKIQLNNSVPLSVENVSLHELSADNGLGTRSVEHWLDDVASNTDAYCSGDEPTRPPAPKNEQSPSGAQSQLHDERQRLFRSSKSAKFPNVHAQAGGASPQNRERISTAKTTAYRSQRLPSHSKSTVRSRSRARAPAVKTTCKSAPSSKRRPTQTTTTDKSKRSHHYYRRNAFTSHHEPKRSSRRHGHQVDDADICLLM